METPTYRIRYADGRVGPACKSRDCAVLSVSPFEGLHVSGIEHAPDRAFETFTTEPVEPPVMGLHFRLAHTAAQRGEGVSGG